MFIGTLSTIIVLLALVAVYFGLRFLGSRSWLLGWLRGMAGLALLGISILLVLVALDLLSYKRLLEDTPIATISLQETGQQQYKATLMHVLEGEEEEFELKGDQWQVDARIIRWEGLLGMFGAKPGYRLDRIAGRYYSLEDERRNERTVHSLEQSEYGMDFWAMAKKMDNRIPGVEAVYGSATYLPMADGALYEISLSNSGLVAKPLNSMAEQAIGRWQ